MFNNNNSNNRGNPQISLFGRQQQQPSGDQQQSGGAGSSLGFGFGGGVSSSFGAAPAASTPAQDPSPTSGPTFGFSKPRRQQQQQPQQPQQKPRQKGELVNVYDLINRTSVAPVASQSQQSASTPANSNNFTTFFPRPAQTPQLTQQQQQQQQQQQRQQQSSPAFGFARSTTAPSSLSGTMPGAPSADSRPISWFDDVDVDPTATGADLMTPALLLQQQPKQHEFTAALDAELAAKRPPPPKLWERRRKAYEDDTMDLDAPPTVPYTEEELAREAEVLGRRGNNNNNNKNNKSVELVVVPGTPTGSGSNFTGSATIRQPIATAVEPHGRSQASSSSQSSAVLQTPAPAPAPGAGANAAAALLNRGARGVMIQTPVGGTHARPDATVLHPSDSRYRAPAGTPAPYRPPAAASSYSASAGRGRPPVPSGPNGKRIDENTGEAYVYPEPAKDSFEPPAATDAGEADERGTKRSIKDDLEYEGRSEPRSTSSSRREDNRLGPAEFIMSVNQVGYVKQAVIGKGGTSMVWRVVLKSESKNDNPRLWALKRVSIKDVDNPLTSIALSEAKTLRRLNNEGCPAVVLLQDYEVDKVRGVLSLVMELGETDMAKALKMREDQPLDLLFVRYYWRMMLECVKVVHEHKVIHSDLKPANFLLVKSKLKLIDFGISKNMADNSTKATWDLPVGTLNYMSPEAVTVNYGTKKEGHVKLNRAADVWSLGCILYQMVYSHTPFAHITNTIEKMAVIADPASTANIEYYHLKARYPPRTPQARVTQADFERFGYKGTFEHDKIPWVPLGGAVDAMEKCLQYNLEDRADIDSLLAHPFLNPDTHVNEKHQFRLA